MGVVAQAGIQSRHHGMSQMLWFTEGNRACHQARRNRETPGATRVGADAATCTIAKGCWTTRIAVRLRLGSYTRSQPNQSPAAVHSCVRITKKRQNALSTRPIAGNERDRLRFMLNKPPCKPAKNARIRRAPKLRQPWPSRPLTDDFQNCRFKCTLPTSDLIPRCSSNIRPLRFKWETIPARVSCQRSAISSGILLIVFRGIGQAAKSRLRAAVLKEVEPARHGVSWLWWERPLAVVLATASALFAVAATEVIASTDHAPSQIVPAATNG